MSIPILQPKLIKRKDFYLSNATAEAARGFKLGGKSAKLILDRASQTAVVTKFDLSGETARKLKRKENVVECIATGINSKVAIAQVKSYLTTLKVPKQIREKSQFFFVSTRRRKTKGGPKAMQLSEEHPIVAEQHFILGFLEQDSSPLLTVVFGRMGAITVRYPRVGRQALNHGSTEEDAQVDPYPDDPTHDFAVCYERCLNKVPDWMLAVVSGICGGCITAVGMLAAGGASVPVVIGVCAACAVAVGVVLGNCFLTCHEMLGS